MLHRFRLLLATALTALVVVSAAAEPPVPIYPLSQVRAGQRAVGKSVFRGTKIESFDLEIIGVLHKFQGTRSVILARVLNGPVVERKSGVIGGMSGSPVYIDGKLVGAVALGWSFSKEPITGITPIEEMLQAWEEGKAQASASAGRSPAAPVLVDGRPVTRVRVGPPGAGGSDPPGVITLTPLGGLIQVSGYNQRAVSRLSELLSPYGLQVMQGAGGGEENLSPPLAPGAGVGAQLVGGDFNISALGTVTLNDGKRILAFGHPLMQLGAVDLPLTGAYVYDIMPNLQMSNKIMAPTKPVGVVYRDHQAAIAGRLGEKADLLPVTMEITDADLGHTRRYSLQVVRTKELMPSLVAISSLTALDEVRGRVTRGTTHVRLEIQVEGRPPLVREEWAYDDYDAGLTVLPLVMQPLMAFTDNPLGSLRFKSVHIEVEAVEQRRTAAIERVRALDSRVRAGETATLLVTVRPHGQPPVDLPVEIALPPDLPKGSVRIAVSSGALEEQARASLGARRPRAVSLDQLVDRYLSRGNGSQLVVQVGLSRRGVGLLGEELPELPAGAIAALRATRPTDLRPAARILKLVKPTKWVLLGRQTISLQVESALSAGPRGAPPPMEPPEEEPGLETGGEETSEYSLDGVPATTWMLPLAVENEGGEDTEQATKSKPGKQAEPLTKAPDKWVHRSKRDYARARLRETAVRSDGRITLALADHELARLDAEVIWCVAVREGVAYVGTGTAGKIYSVSPTGEVKEFFATGEMNVHALAFDQQGNLYAATSPHGRLFRITPDGEGEVVYRSRDTYLWCLAMGPDGTIYAGSGPPGRVHAIRPEATGASTGRVLAALPAANVVSLVRAASGDLYAGTANAGIVYRIAADGSVSTVCRLPAASVEALALDRDGNLYAAGTPGGEVYRIPSGGLPSAWCKTDQRAVYGMVTMEDGDVIAATGSDGLVISIGPEARPEVIFKPETGIATAIAESQGAVYVGLTGPCVLHELGPGYAASGQLESTPLDAGRTARWGRLDWAAAAPEGTEVKAETRSGDSPDPRDHWSDWAPLVDGVIASPPARYLQYRLTLTTEDRDTTPEVTAVRVSRLPQNRPPTCTLKSPLPGDRAAKKIKVKWEAKDPDKDKLVYQVSLSRDEGKTWEDLKKDLSTTQYEWDTSESEDGQYLLRVKATDARSRPDEPLEAEALAPVVVDNTAPQVMIFTTSVSVTEDRRAHLKGMATDTLSPIRSVEYRVGDGPWRSLALPMIEYSLADFSVTTEPLSAGTHEIEVRAFDAAGNSATDRAEVTVEETKEEGEAAEEIESAPTAKDSAG